MKNIKIYLIVLSLCIVGCVTHKYVESKRYLLNVPTLFKSKKQTLGPLTNIFVERMKATVPFDQLNFLYRINSSQYLTDYYNGFLVSPTGQITPLLTNYLKILGDCTVNDSKKPENDYKLRVYLKEFYADYRDRSRPQAVVTIQFVLIKPNKDKEKIVLDRIVSSKIVLKDKDTVSLLAAWNLGVADVLRRGVKMIINSCKVL